MVNLSQIGVDTYGVFTYKDPLIWFAAENFQNWKHREVAIKADPIAKIYICKLDEEILAESPVFTPDIFGVSTSETEPTAEIDKPISASEDVSEEWELERWDKLLLKMFDMARTHSFCVVQLYDRKPYWRVFTDREITQIFYDKNDNPTGCIVEWTKEMPKSNMLRYHKETLSFYNEINKSNDGSALFISFGNPVGANLGEYDLEHIWSDIIFLRYMILDMINNSAKSSGFYHFVYGEAMKDNQRNDLVNAADIAGGMRAIGAKPSILQDIKSHNLTGAEFTLKAIDTMMLQIAGACRLPLSFFRGEREAGGMNSGFAGFIDESKVTEKKKQVFSQFKTFIKKLVEMRWGIIIEDVIPYIKSEQEQQQYESFGLNPDTNKIENKNMKSEDNA